MTTATPSASEEVRDAAELWRHFAGGDKPAERHSLGVEHEKIIVLPSGAAPSYEGAIRQLLERLAATGKWQRVLEHETLIALMGARGEGGKDGSVASGPRPSVTLEPGGQFELSDAPRSSARAAADALSAHMRELAEPARELSLTFLSVGFRPFGTLDDVPWMPKGRYRVMREYMPRHGTRGLEMMKRTSTVQVNLDYVDQADCADKLRVAMGTSSLVTALWASSPLVDGRVTDYQSYRAHCWLDTDNSRCGLLPFVFAASAPERLYRDYAEWALDVPMFFVYRAGGYVAVEDFTFRRFIADGFEGQRPMLADWELHLSTLFPEVRLKQYLEMRGADSGAWPMVQALPAFYRGLLYDAEARRAAWALVESWSFEEREQLRRDVPRHGLKARVGGHEVAPLCVELVRIAREGLVRMGALEDVGLVEPVEQVAREQRTHADVIRELAMRFDADPARLIPALALPLR